MVLVDDDNKGKVEKQQIEQGRSVPANCMPYPVASISILLYSPFKCGGHEYKKDYGKNTIRLHDSLRRSVNFLVIFIVLHKLRSHPRKSVSKEDKRHHHTPLAITVKQTKKKQAPSNR